MFDQSNEFKNGKKKRAPSQFSFSLTVFIEWERHRKSNAPDQTANHYTNINKLWEEKRTSARSIDGLLPVSLYLLHSTVLHQSQMKCAEYSCGKTKRWRKKKRFSRSTCFCWENILFFSPEQFIATLKFIQLPMKGNIPLNFKHNNNISNNHSIKQEKEKPSRTWLNGPCLYRTIFFFFRDFLPFLLLIF